jgi:hypothetical protein
VGDASLRASRWEGVAVPGLTVGVEHERFYRRVLSSAGQKRNIEAESFSVYFGYPLAPWLKAFGTAGQVQVKLDQTDDWSDGAFRGMAGLGAHLWRLEIPDPAFMAGAISLRAAVDYGYASYDQDGESGHWHEASLAATVHYEILAEERPGRPTPPYSVDLYAGPVAQIVTGRRSFDGVDRSFDEARTIGLALGANLFITPALSVGAHVRFFDTFSWRAGIRYSF